MKEDSLSEEKKTETHGDGAHFLLFGVLKKYIYLIVPRSILGQDSQYACNYRNGLNRKSVLSSIVYYPFPLKLAALRRSSKL